MQTGKKERERDGFKRDTKHSKSSGKGERERESKVGVQNHS